MKVNPSNFANVYSAEQLKSKTIQLPNSQNSTDEDINDVGILKNYQLDSTNTNELAASYANPKLSMDGAAIERLMKETDAVGHSVKSLVTDLLDRQGVTLDQLMSGKVKDIKVDETARAEAEKMIGPGGELSPEKVSDRIVDFAKAISGGDKSKIDVIRKAIDQGFAEARHMLGGELPDISNKTYDLIQDKLNKWVNEDESQTQTPAA
ncbi:MAG: DUF5610 domain-containing protein [Candidatus Omnitrophota bacterium]